MTTSGNFRDAIQQVAQTRATQSRTFQFESASDAVRDQNQRGFQGDRKADKRNSSQTGQTPEEVNSIKPPTPSAAVACGASIAKATHVIDPADGFEFGAGISALVGNSLVVSRAGEVPDHSLPVSRQAGTDQPVLRITDASRAPFVSESSLLPASTQDDDGASQPRISSGESAEEKPPASKANGAERSPSDAPDHGSNHLPIGQEARAAGLVAFHSAQTANPRSQPALEEQNLTCPSETDSDSGSPTSIQEDGQPSRHLDLSPPTDSSTELAPQIAVVSQQLFAIANKASDDAPRVRPSMSSKPKQPSHSVEANEDPSRTNLQNGSTHETPHRELPAQTADVASAEGVTARRIANVELRANVGEAVASSVAIGQTQRGSQHDTTANADGSTKPPSLGQASPEDATTNPLPDSSLTGGVIHTARLLESLKESAINLSVRSVDFGNVDIHTAMNHDRLSAQISLERNDLGNALSRTIPGLQSKLSQEHGIQATIEVQQQTSSFSANSGQSQNHSPRPQRSLTAEPLQNAQDSPVLAVPVIADGRIDIRI